MDATEAEQKARCCGVFCLSGHIHIPFTALRVA
jgi:hypothetical protein